MRYLVLSDIHANLEALEAVMDESSAAPFDRVLVLGDLVGYGADPNAVVDRVRAISGVMVIRGNHDKVAVGIEPSHSFNHQARAAIAWTAGELSDDNTSYLRALPQGPVQADPLVEICHGTPFDEDVYVFDELDALRSLRAAARPLCLYGHTHVPASFELTGENLRATRPRGVQTIVTLGPEQRVLVNCGSVGQPRDGDPRAAYGIVDTANRTVTIRRVIYDVATAQTKILAAGLPEVLAQRLGVGR